MGRGGGEARSDGTVRCVAILRLVQSDLVGRFVCVYYGLVIGNVLLFFQTDLKFCVQVTRAGEIFITVFVIVRAFDWLVMIYIFFREQKLLDIFLARLR